MMLIRMLLKSCATPPASRPIASSFCDCRSCSSSARCSVMSRMNAGDERAAFACRCAPPSARPGTRCRRRAARQLEPAAARAALRRCAMYVVERLQRAATRSAAGSSSSTLRPRMSEPLVAEHLLGGRIELADVQLLIHRHDARRARLRESRPAAPRSARRRGTSCRSDTAAPP